MESKPPLQSLLKRENLRRTSNLNEATNSRSFSEPQKDYFSGSMFINDLWKKVLRNSQADKRYLVGSTIREEEDSQVSRELSYFSNISDDIHKLLQSTGNSFLHARTNSEGSNGFTDPKPLDLSFINSLKLEKIISGEKNPDISNKDVQKSKKNDTIEEKIPETNKKNDSFFNKDVLNFLTKNLGNIPAVRMINGQRNQNQNQTIQIQKNQNQNQIIQSKDNNNIFTQMNTDYSSTKAKNAKHMARDQQGSRLLQTWISLNNQKIIDEIFLNIKSDFIELMIDPFGNYLCQRILELIQIEDANYVATKIADKIVLISHNQHGTRSVQKLIEIIKRKEKIELLGDSLKLDVINLAKDPNGNHVIQKCLTYWNPEQTQFIYESIMIKCVDLCCNEIGCRVIQKCLERGTHYQKLDLITLIVGNSLSLITNQYGNYVILRILELKDKDMQPFKKDIADIVSDCDEVLPFIMQKFASKVIEKCLELRDYNFEQKIVSLLLDDKVLPYLISDQYANYVVQSALNTCSEPSKEKIIHKLLQNSKFIRANEFGNMIYQKLSNNFPILNLGDVGFPQNNNKSNAYPLNNDSTSGLSKNKDSPKKENEQQSSFYKIKKNTFKKLI